MLKLMNTIFLSPCSWERICLPFWHAVFHLSDNHSLYKKKSSFPKSMIPLMLNWMCSFFDQWSITINDHIICSYWETFWTFTNKQIHLFMKSAQMPHLLNVVCQLQYTKWCYIIKKNRIIDNHKNLKVLYIFLLEYLLNIALYGSLSCLIKVEEKGLWISSNIVLLHFLCIYIRMHWRYFSASLTHDIF